MLITRLQVMRPLGVLKCRDVNSGDKAKRRDVVNTSHSIQHGIS
jgi:hypothetical protein